MTELKKIDMDVIKEMRMRGLRYEASQLIKAYQEDKKRNKKQTQKEIRRDYSKKYVLKNKDRVKMWARNNALKKIKRRQRGFSLDEKSLGKIYIGGGINLSTIVNYKGQVRNHFYK